MGVSKDSDLLKYHRHIHEGEYVPLPMRSFPVGCSLPAPDSRPRLTSPTLKKVSSPSLQDTKTLQFLEEQADAARDDLVLAGAFPSSVHNHNGPSINSTDHFPEFLHKWTHTHLVLTVLPIPSKDLVVCGTLDLKLLFFDTKNYTLERVISTGRKDFESLNLCLALSKDENLLFSGGTDSLVKVWDISAIKEADGEVANTHVIYCLIDVGDIFSISWSDELSTIFIGTQSAAIFWCTLSLSGVYDGTVGKMPLFRYDKFFDLKGPGGLVNFLQTQQKMHLNEANISTTKPKLIEICQEHIIRFAHFGYVNCLEYFPRSASNDFLIKYSDDYDSILVSGGGDGFVKIWGISPSKTGKSFLIKALDGMDSQDSVLSMSICDSYAYVGLSNLSINVWDLNTLQLIRAFSNQEELGKDMVLSVGLYNNCIFKALTSGGILKITLRSAWDRLAMTEEVKIQEYNGLLTSEPPNDASDPVLTLKIFEHNDSAFLVCGGSNFVSLWDVTTVGDKKVDSNRLHVKDKFELQYDNDHLLRVLHTYVSYRTVSRYPSLYIEDSRSCARFLTKLFIGLSASNTKLIPVETGNPIVYLMFRKSQPSTENTKPTRVLWYAHYDVVDAIVDNNWNTDPFCLTPKQENLYGRGVSDNKGPTLAAIFAVAELFHKKQLSCDVVFIIEGEEECGSIGFQDVITKNKEMIGDIDWVMLSNLYWLDDEVPCLNYGLRGVINATITVESEQPDRHSGVDGGVLREPSMDLIHILGQLVDPKDGDVKIPGFCDDVLPLSKQEIEFYEKIREQDVKQLVAKWRNPSLTVHKMEFSGPNNNTVIPQTVSALILIRVVPNQDLSKIKNLLCKYVDLLAQELNSENEVSVNIFHEAEPWLGDPSNQVYQILFKNLKKTWGPTVPEPLFIREGGSIPLVRFLEKAFNAPAAQIPCGQASDNAHLNNEKLRVLNLFKLRDVLTDTFRELGSNKVDSEGGDVV